MNLGQRNMPKMPGEHGKTMLRPRFDAGGANLPNGFVDDGQFSPVSVAALPVLVGFSSFSPKKTGDNYVGRERVR